MVGLGGKVAGKLALGFLAKHGNACALVEDLGVGKRDQRERARPRGRFALLARLIAYSLSQVIHGLVDHGIPQRVSQRLPRHQRLRRDRDDRPLAAPAARTWREGDGNPDEVETVARPIGQVVAGVDLRNWLR